MKKQSEQIGKLMMASAMGAVIASDPRFAFLRQQLEAQRDAAYQRYIAEHSEHRLAELKERHAMLLNDLENMRHWPQGVQDNMQKQIDMVAEQIARMEQR